MSRLIQKSTFIARQRKAIDYSHKYIVTDIDVEREEANAAKKDSPEKLDWNARAETVIEGFDVVNDAHDRRILFEVNGMRIYRDEFNDEDSSDSQGEDKEPFLLIDYAFMYGNYDSNTLNDWLKFTAHRAQISS